LSTFALRCGEHTAERAAACAALLQRMADERIDQVRVVWSDWHGVLRGKVLTTAAVAHALADGVGLVSTLMLKDTADRTALRVFDPASHVARPVLQRLGQAGNLRLLPDPSSFTPLPWAPGLAWIRAEPWFEDATPVAFDPRRVLQAQLARLADRGQQLMCGVELEFHVYRLAEGTGGSAVTDPNQSDWPPPAPDVTLLHPGYQLLADDRADQLDDVFGILRRVAAGLGLPLLSLEVELGPSQVEAVFGVQPALAAADTVVAFRHAAKQALRRAGYLASFMCKPPFEHAVSSGWHVHHSLRRADAGEVWVGEPDKARGLPGDAGLADTASAHLGGEGASWLAGLLAHASGMTALASPTINGYGRFQGGPMSPLQAVWGLDNRGAMLRVIPHREGGGAHIENRLCEPAANPYLCIAAHVAAGLDGVKRQLAAPPASHDPYGLAHSPDARGVPAATRLPTTLGEALDALDADPLWRTTLGADTVDLFMAIKRAELTRFAGAGDALEWQRREYFERL
jgi:glutamine synthetase